MSGPVPRGAIRGAIADDHLRRLLESVCRHASVALVVMDDGQRCVYMNPAAEQLTGYTVADVQGRLLHDAFHHKRTDGTPYPREECPIDRACSASVNAKGEEIFVHKDGHLYPVAYTVSPVREAGVLTGTIVELRDRRGEKAREDALREESRTLETLNQTGTMLAGKLDMQDVVQAVTDAATELSGAEFGAFFYNAFSDDGESYQLYTLSGAPREAFEKFPAPRNTKVFGPTFRGEGIVRVDDITADPRYGKNPPYSGMPPGHLPVRSYMAVPVISRTGEVLGGLFFGHRDAGVFTGRAERIVAGIAAQAAIAIDNARLMQQTQQEIEQRRRAERELRESEARLRATYDNVQVGICELDLSGRFQAVNEAFCQILGYPPEALLQRTFAEFTHPDDVERNREDYRRLHAGEVATLNFDKRYLHQSGGTIWTNVRSTLIRDEAGRPAYALTTIQDITDRKRAEQHQRLLIDELNHRVKNMLSTIQAIAAQTFRRPEVADALRSAFEGRLLALSDAHSLLVRDNWTGAALHELASQAVLPFGGYGATDRIRIGGEEVRLAPKLALALGMAFHELGTNAVKYGALSVEAGKVSLSWRRQRSGEGDRLQISWQESGGPPVVPPQRRGFGSRLIERGLGRETGGQLHLVFDPSGLRCDIDLPIHREEEP